MSIETKLDESLLPTAQDIENYRRDGFWISQKLYSDAEIEEVLAASLRFYEKKSETDFYHRGWEPQDGDCLRKNDYVFKMNGVLGRFVRKPIVGAIAARLSGSSSIRLWHDQLLWKPSLEKGAKGVTNVGWHTDRGYWQTCTSEEMLTAWVAFQDTDLTNGAVQMVKGSHRWPQLFSGNFFSNDLAGLEKDFRPGGASIEKVPMVLKKGQASFHHCRTIHGSGPNFSGEPRRSIAIHMQPGDNRFRKDFNEKGEAFTHANDPYVRKVDGLPDYTDPFLCPLLFPAG